jgi:hypothetical protein
MNLNVDINPESENDSVTEESETLEFIETEEQNSESVEEEESGLTPSGELLSTEEELDGIVDAISEDIEEDEVEIDEDIIVDSIETFESETEIETEQFDEPVENQIENEIVQDMISDYYGKENQDEPEQESDELLEEELNETESKIVDEQVNEKISSLEDDLLNIFEGLDKEEFEFPERERFSVSDEDEPEQNEVVEEKEQETFASDTTDSFDEYLKSIDEIVFTEKPTKKVEERKVSEVEPQREEINFEKEIEVEEPPVLIPPAPVKTEKKSDNTRNLRAKDLFSYLKRKEVKKIVSYIFANDEEDFTNTAERIMDCGSYKEASDILKAVFTSYKISPYSKEAITFTNAVSNYFRQA